MGQTCSFCRALASRHCNINELINDTTFLPPCPCQYLINDIGEKCVGRIFIGEKVISIPENVSILFLTISSNRSICLFHIQTPEKKAAIIYSHGNASDCGSMLPRCMQLSEKLNVDVIIYDYEGYGYSTGGCSRESICEDVEIVYDYAHQFFPASCIFLYGESIGSVPTLHLAALLKANSSASRSEEPSNRSRSANKNRSVSYSQTGLIFNPALGISATSNAVGLPHPKRSSSFPMSSTYSSRMDDCTVKSPRAIELELDSITSTKPLSSCRHKIAGIILHSAVLSGGRTLFNSDLFRCCDPFDNSKTAKEVQCPVFHIHGMKDAIVPFASGLRLYKYTQSVYKPWWVENGHHTNIVTNFEKEYYSKLSAFIAFCLQQQKEDS